MSGQSGVLDYNRESDDATLPDLSPQGIATSTPLSTSGFQCLEYHLGSDGTIQTWVNGTAITGLTAGPGSSNPNANGWGTAYKPDITGVYFGWESYSGAVNTVWYDDVAVASTRIGCATTGSTSGGGGGSSSSAPSGTTSAAPTTMKTSTTTTAPASSSKPPANCAALYGQCGGQSWAGATCCSSGTCKVSNPYYSQCL